MPEFTNESLLNRRRFEQNIEQTQTESDDEDKWLEIAEFMMATAETMQNPSGASTLRDMANTIVQDKAALAKGGMEQPMEEVPQGLPPLPPGMVGGGLPPQPPI